MTPVVVGFYGKTDSGKTNLIMSIIKLLSKEGYKIASIKKTNKEISIDTKGKDTWRHRTSGAETVVFSSSIETDFIINKKISTENIVSQLQIFGNYDIVLIEGADDNKTPKIRVGDIKKRDNTVLSYSGDLYEVIKTIKKEMKNNKSQDESISVLVNGKTVSLGDFPSEFIKKTVVGMLSSLKDIDEIKDVELKFKI